MHKTNVYLLKQFSEGILLKKCSGKFLKIQKT